VPVHLLDCPGIAEEEIGSGGLGDRLKTGHLWSVQNRPLWMA
jgi:hypothetical protein